jgi:hypothetical protein
VSELSEDLFRDKRQKAKAMSQNRTGFRWSGQRGPACAQPDTHGFR